MKQFMLNINGNKHLINLKNNHEKVRVKSRSKISEILQ